MFWKGFTILRDIDTAIWYKRSHYTEQWVCCLSGLVVTRTNMKDWKRLEYSRGRMQSWAKFNFFSYLLCLLCMMPTDFSMLVSWSFSHLIPFTKQMGEVKSCSIKNYVLITLLADQTTANTIFLSDWNLPLTGKTSFAFLDVLDQLPLLKFFCLWRKL